MPGPSELVYFFDFDGVIVDSVEECFLVSGSASYIEDSFPWKEKSYKELFIKYRGLVGPIYQYNRLHLLLKNKISEKDFNIPMSLSSSGGVLPEELIYEDKFLAVRENFKQNQFEHWLELHKLTSFGKWLNNHLPDNSYILTTKDEASVKDLMEHFNFKAIPILGRTKLKQLGNKRNVALDVLHELKLNSGVVLDDSVEHLTPFVGSPITPYFAFWGYGKNESKIPDWPHKF